MRHLARWGSNILAVAILVFSGCAVSNGAFRGEEIQGVRAADAGIRPGDQVALRIWNEEEMSDTFTVAENGQVILPKLGPVAAENWSVAALQDSIRQAYAEYLRNPAVQITVLRRIGVSGGVRLPGVFLVDLTTSLPDILTQAGGLLEWADPEDILILRGDQRLRFKSSARGDFVQAELHSGDQVIVGYKNFIERNPMVVITTGVSLLGYVVTVILPAILDL